MRQQGLEEQKQSMNFDTPIRCFVCDSGSRLVMVASSLQGQEPSTNLKNSD